MSKSYDLDSFSFRIEKDDEEIREDPWDRLREFGLRGWKIVGIVQFPSGWVEVLLQMEGSYEQPD